MRRPINWPETGFFAFRTGNRDTPIIHVAHAMRTGVKQVCERLYNYADYNLSIGPVSLNDSRRHTSTSPVAISKSTLSQESGTDF